MLAVLLFVVAALTAQVRDAPATRSEGRTGRVVGRVLAADSGRPVARALVTAARDDDPPGRFTDGVVADEQGAFSFDALPAGVYEFTAAKRGVFLDTQYGQTRPDLPGTTVTVAADTETTLECRLLGAGVIAGRVLDLTGEPVALATVTVVGRESGVRMSPAGLPGASIQITWGGQPTSGAVSIPSRTLSNDLGEFRFFGLPPADYLIMATPPPSSREFRRQGLIYFPGVADPSQAGRLALGPGQQITGADFKVWSVPSVRVSGIALGPDGAPVPSGTIALHAAGLEGVTAVAQLGAIKHGSFGFEAAPGTYVLRARHPRMRDDSPYEGDLSAAVPLVIGEAGLEGIRLTLGYGATVEGRIVVESGAPPEPAKFRVLVESGTLGEVRTAVLERSGVARVYSLGGSEQPVTVGGSAVGGSVAGGSTDGGDFSVTGVESGSRRIIPQGPPGLILKGVFLGREDVTDQPVEIAEGQTITDVEIVFTAAKAPLTVTIPPEASTRGTVVVFPERQDWWTKSSRIKTARLTGEPMRFDALPAGEYLVVALGDMAWRSLRPSPRLLEQLRPFAVRVELVEGHETAIVVNPVRLPR